MGQLDSNNLSETQMADLTRLQDTSWKLV